MCVYIYIYIYIHIMFINYIFDVLEEGREVPILKK